MQKARSATGREVKKPNNKLKKAKKSKVFLLPRPQLPSNFNIFCWRGGAVCGDRESQINLWRSWQKMYIFLLCKMTVLDHELVLLPFSVVVCTWPSYISIHISAFTKTVWWLRKALYLNTHLPYSQRSNCQRTRKTQRQCINLENNLKTEEVFKVLGCNILLGLRVLMGDVFNRIVWFELLAIIATLVSREIK